MTDLSMKNESIFQRRAMEIDCSSVCDDNSNCSICNRYSCFSGSYSDFRNNALYTSRTNSSIDKVLDKKTNCKCICFNSNSGSSVCNRDTSCSSKCNLVGSSSMRSSSSCCMSNSSSNYGCSSSSSSGANISTDSKSSSSSSCAHVGRRNIRSTCLNSALCMNGYRPKTNISLDTKRKPPTDLLKTGSITDESSSRNINRSNRYGPVPQQRKTIQRLTTGTPSGSINAGNTGISDSSIASGSVSAAAPDKVRADNTGADLKSLNTAVVENTKTSAIIMRTEITNTSAGTDISRATRSANSRSTYIGTASPNPGTSTLSSSDDITEQENNQTTQVQSSTVKYPATTTYPVSSAHPSTNTTHCRHALTSDSKINSNTTRSTSADIAEFPSPPTMSTIESETDQECLEPEEITDKAVTDGDDIDDNESQWDENISNESQWDEDIKDKKVTNKNNPGRYYTSEANNTVGDVLDSKDSVRLAKPVCRKGFDNGSDEKKGRDSRVGSREKLLKYSRDQFPDSFSHHDKKATAAVQLGTTCRARDGVTKYPNIVNPTHAQASGKSQETVERSESLQRKQRHANSQISDTTERKDDKHFNSRDHSKRANIKTTCTSEKVKIICIDEQLSRHLSASFPDIPTELITSDGRFIPSPISDHLIESEMVQTTDPQVNPNNITSATEFGADYGSVGSAKTPTTDSAAVRSTAVYPSAIASAMEERRGYTKQQRTGLIRERSNSMTSLDKYERYCDLITSPGGSGLCMREVLDMYQRRLLHTSQSWDHQGSFKDQSISRVILFHKINQDIDINSLQSADYNKEIDVNKSQSVDYDQDIDKPQSVDYDHDIDKPQSVHYDLHVDNYDRLGCNLIEDGSSQDDAYLFSSNSDDINGIPNDDDNNDNYDIPSTSSSTTKCTIPTAATGKCHTDSKTCRACMSRPVQSRRGQQLCTIPMKASELDKSQAANELERGQKDGENISIKCEFSNSKHSLDTRFQAEREAWKGAPVPPIKKIEVEYLQPSKVCIGTLQTTKDAISGGKISGQQKESTIREARTLDKDQPLGTTEAHTTIKRVNRGGNEANNSDKKAALGHNVPTQVDKVSGLITRESHVVTKRRSTQSSKDCKKDSAGSSGQSQEVISVIDHDINKTTREQNSKLPIDEQSLCEGLDSYVQANTRETLRNDHYQTGTRGILLSDNIILEERSKQEIHPTYTDNDISKDKDAVIPYATFGVEPVHNDSGHIQNNPSKGYAVSSRISKLNTPLVPPNTRQMSVDQISAPAEYECETCVRQKFRKQQPEDELSKTRTKKWLISPVPYDIQNRLRCLKGGCNTLHCSSNMYAVKQTTPGSVSNEASSSQFTPDHSTRQHESDGNIKEGCAMAPSKNNGMCLQDISSSSSDLTDDESINSDERHIIGATRGIQVSPLKISIQRRKESMPAATQTDDLENIVSNDDNLRSNSLISYILKEKAPEYERPLGIVPPPRPSLQAVEHQQAVRGGQTNQEEYIKTTEIIPKDSDVTHYSSFEKLAVERYHLNMKCHDDPAIQDIRGQQMKSDHVTHKRGHQVYDFHEISNITSQRVHNNQVHDDVNGQMRAIETSNDYQVQDSHVINDVKGQQMQDWSTTNRIKEQWTSDDLPLVTKETSAHVTHQEMLSPIPNKGFECHEDIRSSSAVKQTTQKRGLTTSVTGNIIFTPGLDRKAGLPGSSVQGSAVRGSGNTSSISYSPRIVNSARPRRDYSTRPLESGTTTDRAWLTGVCTSVTPSLSISPVQDIRVSDRPSSNLDILGTVAKAPRDNVVLSLFSAEAIRRQSRRGWHQANRSDLAVHQLSLA